MITDKCMISNVSFLFQSEIKYIADTRGITARRFCALVFHPKCGDWEEVNDWHIPIPDKKPNPEEPFIVRPIFHTF